LDTHKRTISVAMLPPGHREPLEWKLANEPGAVRRLIRRLRAQEHVQCCYEAGPLGYALQRQMQAAGVPCQVIAPSLVPRRSGRRIKTDRRDARKLAELLRAGLLVEVHPPSEEQESVRDLSRCREDAQLDLARARHRLGKFLMRRGLVFRDGWNWSQRHRTWLGSLKFEREADRVVFEDYRLAIEQVEARVAGLDLQIEAVAAQEPYRTPVAWLRCFRGIDTVTGLALTAEMHDIRRFRTAREFMSFQGLVPSEESSGDRQQRGGITRAGNRHVRRLLVESAWHYRHKPGVGVKLRKRRLGQPPEVVALADRAQQHLCRRYRRMAARSKHHNTIVVAIARELAGFIWATLKMVPPAA
jgi:transposase